MGPDIENMTLNEYLEYEAEKERQSWKNVQSKSSPTRCEGADFNSSHHDKSITLDFLHYYKDTFIDIYYALPPLLPYFRPSQPHNKRGYESPNTRNEVDIDSMTQKKEEKEKQITEEQAAKARYWKIPICYDDDEDYTIAITPILSKVEPEDSITMRDEHLDTISATKSNEFIKSSIENLVPNPSKSEGEHECDVPACDDFTTFSNILFDGDYNFSSSDDESFSDEDISKKIYSNPLFDKEIISIKIDLHHFNAEIDKADCDPKEEIRLVERLLYDNSSPRPPEEFISENSNAIIKSFSPSPISVEDSDLLMEEIDLFLASDKSIPPGINNDYSDSEGDALF
nr:hypothetical protein [Tanacetum cinerariifolium]